MQKTDARQNISSTFLSPKSSATDEKKDPEPMQQRREVLYVFSDIVNNFKLFFQNLIDHDFDARRLLTEENNGLSTVAGLNNFQTERLVFNTRFQAQPFAIAMCKTSEEVQQVYRTAIQYNLPVRVRAGGHDHEGECSGDNVVLIDVTGLKNFEYDEKSKVVTLGSGYRFFQLTPKLAELDRMIAHGTCATVGLCGYIQGGGWGPWTRKHGMCCEYLVGAKVVLGNGELVTVSEDENQEILWALRGGGGMSWGIITELSVLTFELPPEIHRFQIEWNQPPGVSNDKGLCQPPTHEYPTIKILQAWENTIESEDSKGLLGTNLKINALAIDKVLSKEEEKQLLPTLHHHCLMYGYWEGTEADLKIEINKWFADVPPGANNITIGPARGSGTQDKYDNDLMGDWGRNSIADVSGYAGGTPGKTALLQGVPFTPDYDAPAPHKITSKLVKHCGLSEEGYISLLSSLTSVLLSQENEHLGLFSYVTLGAIDGHFYQNHKPQAFPKGVSFPYQTNLYTIQYQTWWNEDIKNKIELQNNKVFVDTNRAMDWISASRNNYIDGTEGAFISFKDASIPTYIYFAENYDKLVEIKEKYIEDKFNHLRTRKTII